MWKIISCVLLYPLTVLASGYNFRIILLKVYLKVVLDYIKIMLYAETILDYT